MNTVLMFIGLMTASANDSILSQVQHDFADNEGVKIHYVVMGEGPLVVMIHGFPDFWYSWRNQMKGLVDKFRIHLPSTVPPEVSDTAYESAGLATFVAEIQ